MGALQMPVPARQCPLQIPTISRNIVPSAAMSGAFPVRRSSPLSNNGPTNGKLIIAHATSYEAVAMAQEAEVDVVTPVPLDKALDSARAASLRRGNRLAVPTLVKMYGTAAKPPAPLNDYAHAHASVAAPHEASLPILAGSDANKNASGPAKVAYGASLHRELELLGDAGLSTIETLQAATSLPAKYFGLHDRGSIEVGKRADLVLLSDNPIEDIGASQSIAWIWCGGVEVRNFQPSQTAEPRVQFTVHGTVLPHLPNVAAATA